MIEIVDGGVENAAGAEFVIADVGLDAVDIGFVAAVDAIALGAEVENDAGWRIF